MLTFKFQAPTKVVVGPDTVAQLPAELAALGMDYNLFTAPEKFARIARLLGANVAGLSTMAAAKCAVPALQELLADLDITQDMRSLGVREADIPCLARLAMLDGCTPTNPRPIDEKDFAALFAQGLA